MFFLEVDVVDFEEMLYIATGNSWKWWAVPTLQGWFQHEDTPKYGIRHNAQRRRKVKKSSVTRSLTALLVLIVFSGCAKYQPGVLARLQPEFAPFSETKSGITLSVKKFTSGDSERILNRDVIKKGYQPIQITINNDTKKYVLFSTQGVNLPTVPAQEVADEVHTSTKGRAAAYGVAGLFVWPFLIPAVVDGVGSAQANERLDRDYNAKVVGQMVIQPYGTHNGLIFVPVSEFQNSFEIILVDRETKEKISYRVTGF